jgi:hypothetical protein
MHIAAQMMYTVMMLVNGFFISLRSIIDSSDSFFNIATKNVPYYSITIIEFIKLNTARRRSIRKGILLQGLQPRVQRPLDDYIDQGGGIALQRICLHDLERRDVV